jgi:hypothetical protein
MNNLHFQNLENQVNFLVTLFHQLIDYIFRLNKQSIVIHNKPTEEIYAET